ncbi:MULTISPECIES: LCP family protein [unclassified Gemella]|uniref:LCP family glycopolymer transferase CpsA n=1 Tax=unclassified Gemella TaxID=2624949 RepID=UPI0015D0294B|nr:MULTISPECIES: LCP family protein [unclassified Gemella]MBF0709999.1 LCP family protein [Gemella sp. GL1.1]NYS27343.1 LCP family protein [Gemella sp. GL1]
MNKLLRIVNFIMIVLTIIVTTMLMYSIFKYNILAFMNINYIVAIVLSLILLLLIILLIKNKAKIFVLISSLILLITTMFAYSQINNTVNLVGNLNKNTTVNTTTMSIVVAKDSEINSIKDLEGVEVLAPVKVDSENINKLVEDIKNKEDIFLNVKESESYIKSYDDLINSKNKAIIINSAYENILEMNDSQYHNKVKKVYETSYTKEVTKRQSKVSNNSDVLNIYISGIDTYGPITSVSRSDVNIIMTINKKTNKILLTTTPRDAYVRIADGGNDQYDKLTHAGVYGIDSSIHTLENLYNIDINYYARINFTSFLKLVDKLGGIEVYNEQEFKGTRDGKIYPKGNIQLNSEQALEFVRERYGLSGGDNDRGKNQQKVIAAIIKKLTTTNALSNYQEIIEELSTSIQTDIPVEQLISLANEQIEKKSEYSVSSQALEGQGTMGMASYAMPGYNLYMMKVDEKSLEESRNNIEAVLGGR